MEEKKWLERSGPIVFYARSSTPEINRKKELNEHLGFGNFNLFTYFIVCRYKLMEMMYDNEIICSVI